MAKARLPDWMTGAETWDRLKVIYPDRTDREVRIMLHSAVKDRRVNGRLVGQNAEENLFAARGIVGDVEGDWIRDFILRDPDDVDWDTFLRRTNFLRKDVLKLCDQKHAPRVTNSASPSDVTNFVSQFFKDQIEGSLTPTKSRLYTAAREHLPMATRTQLKRAYNAQAATHNVHVKPGRPRKKHDNSPG